MRKTSNPPNNRFSNNNNSNIDRQAERFRNKFPDALRDNLKMPRKEPNEQEEVREASFGHFGQDLEERQEQERQDFLKLQEQERQEHKEHERQQQEHRTTNQLLNDNYQESNRSIPDMYTAKDKPEDFYTGEKNKKLLIHIIEAGVEVTKPIRKRIYDQQVIWKKRIYPIDIKQSIVDAKGIHHLYVSANDMAILNFRKDHADHCRKCNGKMFIDARNARDLLKRNTIQAIWGIDSTHMILLMVFAVGMMAAVGFAFYSFNQDTRHTAELTAEKAKTLSQNTEIGVLRNQTQSLQNLLNADRDNNNNGNDQPTPPQPIPRRGEPIR